MKYLNTVSAVVVLSTVCAYSGTIETIDECIIRNNVKMIEDGVVRFEGDLVNLPGVPSLPLESKRYVLPDNVIPTSITVQLNGVKRSDTYENCVVEPIEIYTTGEDGSREVIPAYDFDHSKPFPESNLFDFSIGKLDHHTIVSVTTSSYQYSVDDQKLYESDSISYTISYELDNSRASSSARKFSDSRISQIESRSESRAETAWENGIGHYAIFTTTEILPQLESIDQFVKSKEAQGFSVAIYTEETWGGTATDGDPHQVRQWLRDSYEALEMTHLLIIDNPVTGAIPMLKVTPDFSGRYEPLVDMYYGELSGDWDIDGDGKYATYGFFNSKDFDVGGADQYSELYVGRLPYYGDITDINTIMKRIVDYSAESAEDAVWRNHIYTPMNDFDTGAWDGSKYGSVVKKNVIDLSDWNHTSLYGPSCNRPDVISLWNSSNPGFVLWQAHGLFDYAENLILGDEAQQLTIPTHTYQTSCHTGKPEKADNLAFGILRSSAISTIGAAVQCLYSANKSSWGETGGARDYGYFYAKHVILNERPAGPALVGAHDDLTLRSSSNWLNLVEMNLYGCPAVGPHTTDVVPLAVGVAKSIVSTSNSIAISSNANQLSIQLASSDLVGGTVKIYDGRGRVVSQLSLTSGSDLVSIPMNGIASGIYFVDVTINNGIAPVQSVHRVTHMGI